MGFSDVFSDFYNSIGFTEVHAEAPPEEEKEDDEGGEDKGEEESDDGDKEEGGEEGGEEEGGEDEGGDEEEEEEEEEEEPEDIKPKLEEGKFMVVIYAHNTPHSMFLSYGFKTSLPVFPQKWQALAPHTLSSSFLCIRLAPCSKPHVKAPCHIDKSIIYRVHQVRPMCSLKAPLPRVRRARHRAAREPRPQGAQGRLRGGM